MQHRIYWRALILLVLALQAVGVMIARAQRLAPNQRDKLANPPTVNLYRFEAGIDGANLRTGCIGRPECGFPSAGLGFGLSINLNSHFSIDSDINFTPTSSTDTNNFQGGHFEEYLAGMRAEVRSRHYGYFLTGQAGASKWSHVITGVTFPTPSTFTFSYGPVVHFVGLVSGGIEYSPASRVHLRVSVGDLITHATCCVWTNNLQSMAGVYTSFGRPFAWTPPTYNPAVEHPFFGPRNLLLITGSVVAMTADSITTQRFIAHGGLEGDPFAKPLVKYGWSGQISLMGLETTGEILAMYGLHRIHRHWIERMIPVSADIAHGVLAYQNTKVSTIAVTAP